MRLGELVDTAFWIYQRSATKLLSATAAPVSLFWASAAYVSEVMAPSLFVTRTSGGTLDQVAEAVTAVSTGLFVAVPLAAVGLGYSMAHTVETVAPIVRGDAVAAPPRSPWKVAVIAAKVATLQLLATTGFLLACGSLAVLGAVLETVTKNPAWSFLTAIAVFAGVAFGWLSVPIGCHATALAVPVALIEGLSPRKAVTRSAVLLRSVHGHYPSSFATLTVALLLALLGTLILGSLSVFFQALDLGTLLRQAGGPTFMGPIFESALGSLPLFLAAWLLTPVWAVATTLLYFDRVVRLEAYDIRLLLEDVREPRKRTVLLP
jgi:hypothetical protein